MILKEYQDLVRRCMPRGCRKLFFNLTGRTFNILWAPPAPKRWLDVWPAACPVYAEDSSKRSANGRRCRKMAGQHLERTLHVGERGHRFSCSHGVDNYWLAMWLNGVPVGIALIQTRPPPDGGRKMGCGESKSCALEQTAPGLLRLIVHNAVHTAQAKTDRDRLAKAGYRLATHRATERHLRKRLREVMPFLAEGTPAGKTRSRREGIVRFMVDYVHQNWQRPITLAQIAQEIGMNRSYLSSLFSRLVGVPFRVYLKEYRLEKACRLLADPTRRISEVAYAVGYTNPNRFRAAFKEETGYSPTAWRESMEGTP